MKERLKSRSTIKETVAEDNMIITEEPQVVTDKDVKKYTLYIRPEVMKEVKIRAIHEEKSYSSVVEDAIKAYLSQLNPVSS